MDLQTAFAFVLGFGLIAGVGLVIWGYASQEDPTEARLNAVDDRLNALFELVVEELRKRIDEIEETLDKQYEQLRRLEQNRPPRNGGA